MAKVERLVGSQAVPESRCEGRDLGLRAGAAANDFAPTLAANETTAQIAPTDANGWERAARTYAILTARAAGWFSNVR